MKKGFPKTNISMAGFANTTSACFVELDEGTPPSIHPAIHILPPILALSQKLGKSGKDLITAFILGYEVQDRLQLASKLRDGVYPHGNSGILQLNKPIMRYRPNKACFFNVKFLFYIIVFYGIFL